MPIHARKQLRTSKFVRFKLTELVVCVVSSGSNPELLSISHVWEIKKLSFDCVSNYTWNEEWAYMVAKAKYLEVGHGSISFLRQLISCNCVHLECDASFYDGSLDDCQLPWGHILEMMDRKPQPNVPTCPFHFGLFYSILTCFDRRELCQLCNVNHRHYTVIENKFGTTSPYLVFSEQEKILGDCSCCTVLGNSSQKMTSDWRWRPALGSSSEKMPSDVRNQLAVSKFVRFNVSFLEFDSLSESNIVLLSISHVWENQDLMLSVTSNFEWNEQWIHLATKAKCLEVEAKGSINYLRQFTSGNCIYVSLTDWTDTLDTVEIPWDHILGFLLQPNPKDTKRIHILAHSPFEHHQRQTLDFIQQVKQKFLESLEPLDFVFGWETVHVDELIAIDGFIVQNRRTKQSLRLYSANDEFRLTVKKHEP